jgi:hypothetical protein
MSKHLLVGCSFTDPQWQTTTPWSVEYAKTHPSYIVAKAGMGIRGICTEALYFLKKLPEIEKVIIVLPTLWRMDIEVDQETYLCNAMVDLLYGDNAMIVAEKAVRKWITAGGTHFDKNTEHGKLFDSLYKHQGFLVMAKEHLRSLQMLINYCTMYNIKYNISAIQDPLDQLTGLEYIKADILELLKDVDYSNWFRFDNKFIDKFLKHNQHPSTEEHKILCDYILKL